jgi:predicted acetyltransferase
MGIEIRPPLTDAEWAQHSFISAYAFNGDRGDKAVARRDLYYQRDWSLAAFDGAEQVAGLTIVPFEQYINGAKVPLGGVASVSCLPERRRDGYVGALLRASLAQMRDAGQPLSALYTPHYSLYRRFGWELAGRMMSYAFQPKTAKVRRLGAKGTWRRVGADDWATLDAVYTAFYAPRNGALTRSERRWRYNVLTDYADRPRDAAVWSNAAGEALGYVVYSSVSRGPSPGHPTGETVLRVFDWCALDADAYAAVLSYLLGHDLASRIFLLASPDEPLPDALEEPVHIEEPPGAWLGIMLRLVDVQQAIELRPALPQASGKSVTLALTDDAAPWNAGTWRIASHEGRMSAERTEAPAEIEMDARALGPIYNGFMKPADSVRVGAVRASHERAVAALTDVFSTPFAPYCPDDF